MPDRFSFKIILHLSDCLFFVLRYIIVLFSEIHYHISPPVSWPHSWRVGVAGSNHDSIWLAFLRTYVRRLLIAHVRPYFTILAMAFLASCKYATSVSYLKVSYLNEHERSLIRQNPGYQFLVVKIPAQKNINPGKTLIPATDILSQLRQKFDH